MPETVGFKYWTKKNAENLGNAIGEMIKNILEGLDKISKESEKHG